LAAPSPTSLVELKNTAPGRVRRQKSRICSVARRLTLSTLDGSLFARATPTTAARW